MIDLLSITIEIDHHPFGSIRSIKREEGLSNAKTKRLSHRVIIKDVPICVTSLKDGTEINIRCCPLKVLQGHNVFGSNSVRNLGLEIIEQVLEQLHIKPSKKQRLAWEEGEFLIDEIHLTHRFPISSYAIIKRLVAHIQKNSSMSLCPSVIERGVGITLKDSSRLVEWLFYDKCLEFCDKRRKEHKYLEARTEHAEAASKLLKKDAAKTIRAELKLRKKYLVKHDLSYGKNWTIKKVLELYRSELELLRLGMFPTMSDIDQTYNNIENKSLRTAIYLWATGADLTQHYKRTTLEKYRREIRELLNVDILKDQPTNVEPSISLSNIFNRKKLLRGFPRWCADYPELAFR